MVAPKLSRLDLWVKALGKADPQGALELLAQPLQATKNGTPLPNWISISYGVCEASVEPYTAARTLFDRQAAATAALGITIVVAAGDSGSSSCAHGVPSSQLNGFDKQKLGGNRWNAFLFGRTGYAQRRSRSSWSPRFPFSDDRFTAFYLFSDRYTYHNPDHSRWASVVGPYAIRYDRGETGVVAAQRRGHQVDRGDRSRDRQRAARRSL